jgi:hypothetical protein
MFRRVLWILATLLAAIAVFVGCVGLLKLPVWLGAVLAGLTLVLALFLGQRFAESILEWFPW